MSTRVKDKCSGRIVWLRPSPPRLFSPPTPGRYLRDWPAPPWDNSQLVRPRGKALALSLLIYHTGPRKSDIDDERRMLPMRAAYIDQTGPPEVIQVGELPRPEPRPGQVLVQVHAAALNPIDLYIRSGLVAMPLAFPYVIACDLAGTVERRSGLLAAGFAWATASGARTRGCWAARVSRPSTPPSTRPGSIPRRPCCQTTTAAAMALVGITAHLGLFQFGQAQQR